MGLRGETCSQRRATDLAMKYAGKHWHTQTDFSWVKSLSQMITEVPSTFEHQLQVCAPGQYCNDKHCNIQCCHCQGAGR